MAGTETEITFTSRCISSGESLINSPASTTSGLVEVEYEANGCAGDDTIKALGPDNSTAQITLNIAQAFAYNLIGNTPEPNSIAPSGNATSARPSNSVVSFNVVDETGNPVKGADVTFALSYSSQANSSTEDVRLENTSTTSGSGGTARTRVIAGEQNTVVRVIATIQREDGSTASTISSPISINAFVPDQDSFSMSIDKFMPNAQFHNNEKVTITINAADRFNNNNLEGNTVVAFTTTGGSIENYCVLDASGVCTVTWTSTDPRPASGRVAILARSVGDESFRDLNSNDEFDDGEFVSDSSITFEAGEAYMDFTTDGSFTAGSDQFFDDNGNSSYDAPNGTYDGSGCLNQGTQNCTEGPVTIWDQAYIVMASDAGIQAVLAPSGNPDEYCVTASGATAGGQRVPLPTDTSIAFSIEDGEIISSTPDYAVENSYVAANEISQCIRAGQDDDLGTTPRLTVTLTPPSPYGGAPIERSITL
ncbi:hypothetical protein [Marinobacter sediminum]|uniref:hypothetical protein n=1 Tax=Marinobacter sediminum TaxID=256323 RepID=UPI00193ADB61|nr:hypothetical protein [Marinobacter sediminum]